MLGHVYVSQHFPADSKTEALKLIHNIENAFRDNMLKMDWMDNTTRNRSLQKLDMISNKIGYPDVWPSYRDLQKVQKGKYFEAAMQIR